MVDELTPHLHDLESWIIAALAEFNVKGEIREGRVGVWVTRPEKPPLPDGSPREDKIAALGIRLRRWVSFHGLSITDGATACRLPVSNIRCLVFRH